MEGGPIAYLRDFRFSSPRATLHEFQYSVCCHRGSPSCCCQPPARPSTRDKIEVSDWLAPSGLSHDLAERQVAKAEVSVIRCPNGGTIGQSAVRRKPPQLDRTPEHSIASCSQRRASHSLASSALSSPLTRVISRRTAATLAAHEIRAEADDVEALISMVKLTVLRDAADRGTAWMIEIIEGQFARRGIIEARSNGQGTWLART